METRYHEIVMTQWTKDDGYLAITMTPAGYRVLKEIGHCLKQGGEVHAETSYAWGYENPRNQQPVEIISARLIWQTNNHKTTTATHH